MIKVGSRVKFVSDTGVGVVRALKGNMANVEVEDGFEIPALLSDLVEVEIEQENAAIVRIGPSDPKPVAKTVVTDASGKKQRISAVRGINNYGRVSLTDDYEDDEPIDLGKLRRSYNSSVADENTTVAVEEPAAPEKAPWELTDYTVKLLFVPQHEGRPATEDDLDAYLVNDSSYTVLFNVARWERGSYLRTLETGMAHPDTKLKVGSFRRADLAEIITLRISLLPCKPTAFMPQPVEAFDLELHPLRFVRPNSYTENDYFDAPALAFTLASSDAPMGFAPVRSESETATEKPLRPKAEDRVRPSTSKKSADEEVIDLHADEILDSTEGMQPGEIIKTQLARFAIALDGAIKEGTLRKIVFIHGMGKGKLRYEIEKALKRDYSKLRYQDASFAEYGYGAILVFLR